MMNSNIIGNRSSLVEGGRGLRFDVEAKNGDIIPAFAVLFDGQYFAYLNRCGHIAIQLDYAEGEFFSDDGQTLICSTHGAEYAPDSGACLGGPCYGVGLDALTIKLDGELLILGNEDYQVVSK